MAVCGTQLEGDRTPSSPADVTGQDVHRVVLGWPRCPECGAWMQPQGGNRNSFHTLAANVGIRIRNARPIGPEWVCNRLESHKRPHSVLIYNGQFDGWTLTDSSGNTNKGIEPPRLLPRDAIDRVLRDHPELEVGR